MLFRSHVGDDGVHVAGPATQRPAFADLEDDVAFVSLTPGMDASSISAAISGRRGAVVEGFGNLNVPMQAWGPLHEASRSGCLVVIASRAFTPSTTREGFDDLGVIGAGGLSAQKARLAVMAALGTASDLAGAIELLRHLAVSRPPHERSST